MWKPPRQRHIDRGRVEKDGHARFDQTVQNGCERCFRLRPSTSRQAKPAPARHASAAIDALAKARRRQIAQVAPYRILRYTETFRKFRRQHTTRLLQQLLDTRLSFVKQKLHRHFDSFHA